MSKKRDQILDLLCDKTSHKQEVFRNTQHHFDQLKAEAQEMAVWMHDNMCQVDESVELNYEDLNKFEGSLRFGGDTILLNMHTNVFTFEKDSAVWKNRYVREDSKRGYFGIIHLYNFLTDSIRFDRQGDSGVLLCRILVNSEGHYFVEGQQNLSRPLGFLYRQKLNPKTLRAILEEAIHFAIEFDLTAPAFQDVMLASVSDMRARSSELQLRTTKKLGYKY